jgi:hypothetical protein
LIKAAAFELFRVALFGKRIVDELVLPINLIRELDGKPCMIVVQGSDLQDGSAPAAWRCPEPLWRTASSVQQRIGHSMKLSAGAGMKRVSQPAHNVLQFLSREAGRRNPRGGRCTGVKRKFPVTRYVVPNHLTR